MLSTFSIWSRRQPKLDLSKLTREQAAAIKDIRIEDPESKRRVHIRMNDKLPALLALSKLLKAPARHQKVIFAECIEPPAAIEEPMPENSLRAHLERVGALPPAVEDRTPSKGEVGAYLERIEFLPASRSDDKK